ncbi:MAG: tRNA (adenosine(37)-N6)-threonylcarbamoyltransferase complex dimerization subunit type 1 TsaB [Lentisphaerota bacterium]
MISLAFEMSSRQGSLALFKDREFLVEKTWLDEGVRSQNVFKVLAGLLKETGTRVEEINSFFVGRGPGSYTGLRVALTAAQALALPGGGDVYCLSSGEAMAAEILAGGGARHVAVTGDARREQFWLGVFRGGEQTGQVEEVMPWTLVGPAELPGKLPPDTRIVSSDWVKKETVFRGMTGPGIAWREEDVFPRAEWIGRAGWARKAGGKPSEPPMPIYMHPAVMVAPFFPDQGEQPA